MARYPYEPRNEAGSSHRALPNNALHQTAAMVKIVGRPLVSADVDRL